MTVEAPRPGEDVAGLDRAESLGVEFDDRASEVARERSRALAQDRTGVENPVPLGDFVVLNMVAVVGDGSGGRCDRERELLKGAGVHVVQSTWRGGRVDAGLGMVHAAR